MERLIEESRNEMKETFYHILLPHILHMCTRIKYFATSLQGATKTVKFVEVVPSFVLTEMLLCRAIFETFWWLFIGDDLQLCTPVQIFLFAARWRYYRVSNFKPWIFRFSAHVAYYCDFLNNVYR